MKLLSCFSGKKENAVADIFGLKGFISIQYQPIIQLSSVTQFIFYFTSAVNLNCLLFPILKSKTAYFISL